MGAITIRKRKMYAIPRNEINFQHTPMEALHKKLNQHKNIGINLEEVTEMIEVLNRKQKTINKEAI